MPLIELLQHMCGRPRMYVRTGTFEEVATFLEGYDSALNEFAPEEVKAVSLREFGRWLSYTHEDADMMWLHNGEEIEASLAWASKVRRVYPVDSDALEALPVLYRRFLDDIHRVAWPLWPPRA